jgi:tryptophan-rich sensory protein
MGKTDERWRLAGGLVVWVVIVFGAAYVGSQFTLGEWYAQLDKPTWTPPSAVFAPVWTILYLLMAVAAWLVWARFGVRGASAALAMFLFQLALNVAWSWLFFNQHAIGLALGDIMLLWAAIVATITLFAQKRRLAAALLAPYLLWVSYAGLLNLALWQLNR